MKARFRFGVAGLARAVLNRSGAPDTIRTYDLCLRRARFCGLIWQSTSGWRPSGPIVSTMSLDWSTVFDTDAFDRGSAGAVFAFTSVGFNERGIRWRQHASNPAGLSRMCAPQSFRQAHFANHENRHLFSSSNAGDSTEKVQCLKLLQNRVRQADSRRLWAGRAEHRGLQPQSSGRAA